MTSSYERRMEVVRAFTDEFLLMSDVGPFIGYAPQYARQLVLQHGVADVDYVLIGGRYFVSKSFLKELTSGKSTRRQTR